MNTSFSISGWNISPYLDYIIQNQISGIVITRYDFQESLSLLPDQITTVFLAYSSLPDFQFPRNLKVLHISRCAGYDLAIFKNLPSTLKELYIYDEEFNEPLYYLPLTLEILEVPWTYNAPLDYLPSSLQKIIISKKYPTHHLANIHKNTEIIYA